MLAVLADDFLDRLHLPILAGQLADVEFGLRPLGICD
jgi:hypothetical protein